RVGHVVGAAQLDNNIGEIRSDQGHLDEAAASFREIKAIFDAAGHRTLAALTVSNLGRLAARSGRLDEALDLQRRALVGFEEIGAGSFVLEAKARLANAGSDEADEARDLFEGLGVVSVPEVPLPPIGTG